jgi:ribonuclease Z
MTTEVILTGTGVPHPRPGRAGAGTLVRHGGIALQFDGGRSTVMRLMEAETPPHALSAVFLTHVHSDHVVGLADLAMTRWIAQQLVQTGPLVVVAAEGVATRFVRRMLDPSDDDLALRAEHTGAPPIEVVALPFELPTAPAVVWTAQTAMC